MCPVMSLTMEQPRLHACRFVSPSELETYLILRALGKHLKQWEVGNLKATSGQKWEDGLSLVVGMPCGQTAVQVRWLNADIQSKPLSYALFVFLFPSGKKDDT